MDFGLPFNRTFSDIPHHSKAIKSSTHSNDSKPISILSFVRKMSMKQEHIIFRKVRLQVIFWFKMIYRIDILYVFNQKDELGRTREYFLLFARIGTLRICFVSKRYHDVHLVNHKHSIYLKRIKKTPFSWKKEGIMSTLP